MSVVEITYGWGTPAVSGGEDLTKDFDLQTSSLSKLENSSSEYIIRRSQSLQVYGWKVQSKLALQPESKSNLPDLCHCSAQSDRPPWDQHT